MHERIAKLFGERFSSTTTKRLGRGIVQTKLDAEKNERPPYREFQILDQQQGNSLLFDKGPRYKQPRVISLGNAKSPPLFSSSRERAWKSYRVKSNAFNCAPWRSFERQSCRCIDMFEYLNGSRISIDGVSSFFPRVIPFQFRLRRSYAKNDNRFYISVRGPDFQVAIRSIK